MRYAKTNHQINTLLIAYLRILLRRSNVRSFALALFALFVFLMYTQNKLTECGDDGKTCAMTVKEYFFGLQLEYGGSGNGGPFAVKKYGNTTNAVACKLPSLNPFHPNIMKYYKVDQKPLVCKQKVHSYIKHGYIFIKVKSVTDAKLYNVTRLEDSDVKFTLGRAIDIPKMQGTDDIDYKIKATCDFYKLVISFTDGDKSVEFLISAIPKSSINSIKENSKTQLNMLFLVFDSISNAQFLRSMPRTLKYLKGKQNSITFKGHTIVGDGTTAQLTAMLTDDFEEKLPEAKKGYNNTGPVDRWPFIFSWLKSKGYVTMYSEDDPSIASFNYRLHGFKKQPSDHYSRPFWLAKEEYRKETCSGGYAAHQYHFQYVTSLFQNYPKNVPKFAFAMMSKLTHNYVNDLQYADEDLVQLLESFDKTGYLNKTAVFIMGDHGNRVAEFRATLQGKLEERLTQFSLILPRWFSKKHQLNLEHNSLHLTSHFDIYASIKHIADYPAIANVKYGQSLLTKIDEKKRNCEDAGIQPHWCPCLEFQRVSALSEKVTILGKSVIRYINDLLTRREISKKLCSPLQIQKVLRAGRREPSALVQSFNPWGFHLSDAIRNIREFIFGQSTIHGESYELVIEASVSGGLFEANVYVENGKIYVDPSISRINKYGDQPKCIQNILPSLRKFCYCKN